MAYGNVALGRIALGKVALGKTGRRLILAGALVILGSPPDGGGLPEASAAPAWEVPDIDALPDTEGNRRIRAGGELVARTYSLIGPLVADPAKRYAGNNLACKNCHLDDGTRRFGLPLWGLTRVYPQYDPRSGRTISLAERVNLCMTRSMNGRPLPEDGPEMQALLAYLDFLSSGLQAGQVLDGYGAGHLADLARAADPQRGLAVYTDGCLRCHGADGEGIRRNASPGDLGYVAPPLWGPDAFNVGAGMKRLGILARFTHNNMPNGVTYEVPRLSPDDSWDVAAYIVSKQHPPLADLDKDYPNRIEKPVDTPYGPYADGFPAEQHIYGPFGPIRDALETLKAGR
jgi:thiosulfate dehydrogenase